MASAVNCIRGEQLQVCPVGQAELGRDLHGQRWGPRPLDLDIIFYEGLQVQEGGLEIPHPRWQERPFVKVSQPGFVGCELL